MRQFEKGPTRSTRAGPRSNVSTELGHDPAATCRESAGSRPCPWKPSKPHAARGQEKGPTCQSVGPGGNMERSNMEVTEVGNTPAACRAAALPPGPHLPLGKPSSILLSRGWRVCG